MSLTKFMELKSELQVWQQKANEKGVESQKLKDYYKEQDKISQEMIEQLEDMIFQNDQNNMTIEQTKQQIDILKDLTVNVAVDQSRIAEAQDMYEKVIKQLKQEK